MELETLAAKPPVVATHIGGFDTESALRTFIRYEAEAETYVQMPEIRRYEQKFIETLLQPKPVVGCLVAPFGYGKTSTAIHIWKTCREEGLCVIPPFSCSSIAEMGAAITSSLEWQLNEDHDTVEQIRTAYQSYLVSSAERLAQQDAERYQIDYEAALKSNQEKIEKGYLQIEASSTHLLKYLEELVKIVKSVGYQGFVIIVDEFQQFLGNINKSITTNFRTLIWGLRTRGALPIGLLLTMDPDTEINLNERAGDILHRIREDGLYLSFASLYNREFPRQLWSRYADQFGFTSHSAAIVHNSTLEAIGQICERPDLSNGPRTVINAFQRIADVQRGEPYSPIHLIEDFIAGEIKFDGNQSKIASLVNELSSYDYFAQNPERLRLLKLLAAFPRGCPREVAAQYVHESTFDQLLDELRGEVLLELTEGVALIDLQRAGKPQNKLNIILKKYWMQITEQAVIAEKAMRLFTQYAIPPLFPNFSNTLSGWRTRYNEFQVTRNKGYIQWYEGTFSEEFPLREVCVQVCADDSQIIEPADFADMHLIFVMDASLEQRDPAQIRDGKTLLYHIPINLPFERALPRDLKDIEDYLKPVLISPGVLLSLVDYIKTQAPQVEGISHQELARIENRVEQMVQFLLVMLFSGETLAQADLPLYSRGSQAIRDLVYHIIRRSYRDYHTLITSPQWQTLAETYISVLQSLTATQRRGLEPLHENKNALAARFNYRSHAGFESNIRQFDHLTEMQEWSGDKGRILFTRHTGEDMLLHEISVRHGVTEATLTNIGRIAGYRKEEILYLLKFLLLRGYIEYNEATGSYIPANALSQAELEQLAHFVRLEAAAMQELSDNPTLHEIQVQAEMQLERVREGTEHLPDIQVILFQRQRQLQILRPEFTQSVRSILFKYREQIYQAHEQLEKAIPEAKTGLDLDSHINGAARKLSDENQQQARRLMKFSEEINRLAKVQLNTDSGDPGVTQDYVGQVHALRAAVELELQNAQICLERIQIHKTWITTLDRIKRLRELILQVQNVIDTTVLQARWTELQHGIQQELASEGMKDYYKIWETFQPELGELQRELELAVQVTNSGAAPITRTNGILSDELKSQVIEILYEQRVTLRAIAERTLLPPAELYHVLAALEEGGQLQIHFELKDE